MDCGRAHGQTVEQTGWENLNFPPELYLPLFQFARINRIPIAALNVERTLTETVANQGWDAVPTAQQEGVSRPAPGLERLSGLPVRGVQSASCRGAGETGTPDRNDTAFRFFVESQTTWDRMAEALARRLDVDQRLAPARGGHHGSGNVRNGHGVPHQLRDLGISNIAALLPDIRQDCESVSKGFADGVYAMPEIPRDKPRRRGWACDWKRLKAVSRWHCLRWQPAEQTAEARRPHPVDRRHPCRQIGQRGQRHCMQPAGTWLPMQIQRGVETLDVVIKFRRGNERAAASVGTLRARS